jgi:hypothetical protein
MCLQMTDPNTLRSIMQLQRTGLLPPQPGYVSLASQAPQGIRSLSYSLNLAHLPKPHTCARFHKPPT